MAASQTSITLNSSSNSTEIKQIASELTGIVSVESRNNLSPVFTSPIDQHVGIQIEGQFKTNDSSDEGKMSYITVRRSPDIAVPFDGYGLAWRKGDGSSYNVYIVDNDALNSDVFINEEQIWDQTGGTNQFLAAAAKEILVDTWYKFVIKIYDKNGIDIWIDPADTFDDSLLAEDRTIYRGQTYPAYITQSSGDHFGFGVIETLNSEWWYKSVKITNITETYPMMLFKLKCKDENFVDGEEFSVTFQGIGWGDGEDSLKWYIRNQNTQNWDLGGNITVGTGSTTAEMISVKSLTDIADYRDGSDYVNVLATPYNYNDDEHYLRAYYVGATNILLSGIHTGNMSDIYINSRDKIEVATQSFTMTSREITFRTSSGFILPILDIVAITRSLTGAAFVENVDYVVERPNQGTAFSTTDSIKVVFSDDSVIGLSLDFVYRYYSDGLAIQELLESDLYRYPGASIIGKIYPYTIIDIDVFEYRGPVAVEVVRDALISYINSIDDGALEISDLVVAAYGVGVTFVDLSSVSITVKDQSYLGTYVKSTLDKDTTYYNLSGSLKTFFADTTSIYGISKLT